MLGVVVAVRAGVARGRRCATSSASSAAAGAGRGDERADARPLAAHLLARHQPPDPERRRPPRTERRGTPYVAIAIAAALAFALALAADIEFLAGIFAFGAMLAFTIAHVSVIVLRFREPDRPSAFRVPLSIPVGARLDPAAGGARRAARRSRAWVERGRAPRGRAHRRRRSGWSLGSRSTSSTAGAGQVAHAALHDPGRGAPGGRAGRVRQHPRAGLRRAARRRHRRHRRAAGGRGGRGGRGRRRDRGALRVRDPDVAADRRARAGRADRARRSACSRAPRRWARSTRAWRWRRRWCAAARSGRRSWPRRAGAGWRRSCWPPRSRRGIARRRPARRARRAARPLRGRDHPLRASRRRPAG